MKKDEKAESFWGTPPKITEIMDPCVDCEELNNKLNSERSIAEELAAVLEHAISMEHFTPGGSTEGWAKEVLERFQKHKESK